ncbi:MAG: protein SCO1/2 [Gammaproteobacteria bacterium]|jgi:protein SCO1/2
MRYKYLVSGLVVAAAFAAGILFSIIRQNEIPSVDIPGLLSPNPPFISPFKLRTSTGSEFTEANFAHRWTLIFFGFTNCPDICPTTMSTLRQLYQQWGSDSDLKQDLQIVFVSVDPERDNDETLTNYVSYFDPSFVGVTGNEDELNSFAGQFGALFMKVNSAGIPGYAMDHSASVLLVAPSSHFVGLFSPPHEVGDIKARLKRMIEFIMETTS